MDFATRLKEARIRKRYTQEHLASIIGVAKSTITSYEKGNREPDVNKIKLLSKALDVSGSHLLGLDADSDNYASYTEQNLIKKYRALDEHGKEMVDIVIEKESSRMEAAAKEAEVVEAAKSIKVFEPLKNYLIKPYAQNKASAGFGIYLSDDSFDYIKIEDNLYTRTADFFVKVSGDSMLPRFKDGDIVIVQKMPDVLFGQIGIWAVDNVGYIKQKGQNELISLNPEYDDVRFSEFEEVHCFGRVIGMLDETWVVDWDVQQGD